MAGVDIGPFQNIVNVGWGSASIKATVVDFGPTFRYVEFQEVDEVGDPVVNDGTVLQGLMTGVDSGATADFSLLPVVDNAGPSTLYVFPGCAWAPGGFYNMTTGAASTAGEAPTLAGYIENTVGGTSAARVWSIPTASEDSGSPPTFCVHNGNGPALPGFISGEDVTVVKPPPEE